MEIVIRSAGSGTRPVVTDALREAVEGRIAHAGRLLEGMDRAEVRFVEDRQARAPGEREVCEVTIHGHGHVVRARAMAADPLTAVDRVVDKLAHRMEKLRGKLAGRSRPRRDPSVHFLGNVPDSGDDVPDAQPRIVKTKTFDMKPMTPEEAALQMDLVGHDFYFFTSSETGQAGVVYRRNDGQIGLIDAG
jgi:putative sigma-54 modulation protein